MPVNEVNRIMAPMDFDEGSFLTASYKKWRSIMRFSRFFLQGRFEADKKGRREPKAHRSLFLVSVFPGIQNIGRTPSHILDVAGYDGHSVKRCRGRNQRIHDRQGSAALLVIPKQLAPYHCSS